MHMKKHAAELLGTFALVLMGTGAIIVDQETGGAIGHTGISLVFGLVVLAMIQTFGDVSGAHLNPAVSVALAAAGRFPWRAVPGYAAAQAAGAFAASGLLRALFPANAGLGATLPAGPPGQSFILEAVLTGLLVLTILSVTIKASGKGLTIAATVGAVIALEALFAGPISGASMNPFRSLAPAVLGGHFTHLWIYLTAPLLGAWLAVPLCTFLRTRQCCPGHPCVPPITNNQ